MNLDYSTIKNTILWVLVAIAVVGIVLAIIIKKIIGKVITLVLAAVLIGFGWQQRARVIDFANDFANDSANTAKAEYCATHPSFFGITVNFPGCAGTTPSS